MKRLLTAMIVHEVVIGLIKNLHSKLHDRTELCLHGIESITAAQSQLYGHAVIDVAWVDKPAVEQQVGTGTTAIADEDLLPDAEVPQSHVDTGIFFFDEVCLHLKNGCDGAILISKVV